MMKPVIILLIIFFAIRFLRKSLAKKYQKPAESRGSSAQPSKEAPSGEEMVLDPVCNSYIPVSTAISSNAGGHIEYFCSEECRERFLRS